MSTNCYLEFESTYYLGSAHSNLTKVQSVCVCVRGGGGGGGGAGRNKRLKHVTFNVSVLKCNLLFTTLLHYIQVLIRLDFIMEHWGDKSVWNIGFLRERRRQK